MATHPGRIKQVINVYMGTNRTLDLKDTPEFIEMRKHINHLLYDE